MTPFLAKAVVLLVAVGWYVIRYPYQRRARRNPVARTERGPREYLLMGISTAGFGLIPFVYICFDFPRSADYPFHPTQAWLGVLVALGSLFMFRLTHRALGHYWSVSLDLREQHALVTDGIYRYVRHPMYTGMTLTALATPFALGSYIAASAFALIVPVLIYRLIHEERTLRRDLAGYEEYCKRVRRRLVPSVW